MDDHVDMFHLADLLQGISVDFSPVKDVGHIGITDSHYFPFLIDESFQRRSFHILTFGGTRWNLIHFCEGNQSIMFHVFYELS